MWRWGKISAEMAKKKRKNMGKSMGKIWILYMVKSWMIEIMDDS